MTFSYNYHSNFCSYVILFNNRTQDGSFKWTQSRYQHYYSKFPYKKLLNIKTNLLLRSSNISFLCFFGLPIKI